MAPGVTRFVGVALGAVLLLAGCTPDEGRSGEPVSTSPAATPSIAVPEPSTIAPEPSTSAPVTATSPPSRLPTATQTRVTRPTVPASSDGPTGLPTATATGTGSDGVPTGTADFDQPFAFPSGLTVTVARPVPFTPSAQVRTIPGMTYVWVEVSLRNTTATPIDVGLVGHDATAGGVEATRVYDPAHDILAPRPGELGPGQLRRYRVGFAQTPGQALSVRTAYGWDAQVVHS